LIDLTDEDRALIELARDAHAPSDEDRARVRAALASRLGTAAGLGIAAGLGAKIAGTTAATTVAVAAGTKTATATAATAAASTAGATGVGTVGLAVTAAKVIGAAVLVSVTVGVGATVIHHQRRVRSVAPVTVASAVVQKPARPHPAVAAPLALAPRPEVSAPPAKAGSPALNAGRVLDVPVSEARPPAPAPAKRIDDSPAPAVVGPTGVQPAASSSRRGSPTRAVADEAALVHASLVARRSGHPAQALELLDRHMLLFPQGVLAQERDAERALVLADLGRTADARVAIDEFLRAHPGSPLAARLRERQRLLDAARP
jgi:hypothetical protein